MTDIIGSILIGITLVLVWAGVTGMWNWVYGKMESYRHAKWNDKNLKFIKHILRRNKR